MSVEITITSSRALACSGRLVAGETADITVKGGAAASLYLVDNKREVIAVCTSFDQGAGSINLATVPIGDMVFGIPAGRLVTVMALIKDAAGSIIGYGSLPLVSAPMPSALIDLDIDFYLRASQVGEGLAIVDGKLVCTIAQPTRTSQLINDGEDGESPYVTEAKAEAGWWSEWTVLKNGADVTAECPQPEYAPVDAVWSCPVVFGGGTWILAAVVEGADDVTHLGWALGSSEYTATRHRVAAPVPTTPEDIGAQPALTAQQLANIAAVPSKADAADLRYALDAAPRVPDPVTGKYAMNDREANWIQPDGASVTLVFPEPVDGRLRDFEVYVESLNGGSGNVSLTCEGYNASDVLTLGNGAGAVPDIPLGGDTVLYFSEVKEGRFILKGEEYKAITQGGN